MQQLIPTLLDGKRRIASPELEDLLISVLDVKAQDVVLCVGTSPRLRLLLEEIGATIDELPLNLVTRRDLLKLARSKLQEIKADHYTLVIALCGLSGSLWTDSLKHGGRAVFAIGRDEVQKPILFEKVGFELIPRRVISPARFQMLEE